MLSEELNKLKELCKDEQSFNELKKIVAEVIEERDRKARALSLLESAISNDYDSILITEFELEKPGPRIVYVNENFCKMTGYSESEVIGKTPRILQGPKTDKKVLDELKYRLNNGRCFFGQTINYKKDGTEFVNQWDIHPLFDEDGNPTHWVSYQHDISKRKCAEQQFIDTKIEFDKLREKAHCITVDIDSTGSITAANQAFCKMLGYDKDTLKGHKVWDLASQKDKQALREYFQETDVGAGIEQSEFEGKLKHKAGIPIQIKGQVRPLNLKDGKIIRAEIQNISLQKKVRDALQTDR